MVSSIKNARDTAVGRESGKRLYVSPKEYQDQIRRGTIKGFDQGAQPWSEFEKPYWEDSYEEMEYFMWNWPGFAPWRWNFNFDNPSIPTNLQGSLGGTDFLVCDCFTLGGFCPGDTRCIAMDCTYPIVGVQFSQRWAEREFSVEIQNEQTICITATEDASLGVELDIYMQLPSGNICVEEDLLIGTASDCEDCDTADPMEAGPDNPTVVVDGTNYRIDVINGVGPFTWVVTALDSADVSLQWAIGDRRYNYLNVVDGCGSISVTVTDSCGTIVVLFFYSDDGIWQECEGYQTGGNCFDDSPVDCPLFFIFGGYLLDATEDNEHRFSFGDRIWRYRRPVTASSCNDIGLPYCCEDTSPDCSPNPPCFGIFDFSAPFTCSLYGYPDVEAPCYNPCGGKGATGRCGISHPAGDGISLEFYRCD